MSEESLLFQYSEWLDAQRLVKNFFDSGDTRSHEQLVEEFLSTRPLEPEGTGALVSDRAGRRWVRGERGWTNLDASGPYLNWSGWNDVLESAPIEFLRDGVS